MSLGAGLRDFKAKAMGNADKVVRETMLEFADVLVEDLTPLGDPESWKSPPPADYRPGNLRSSWFYAPNAPSTATTDSTTEHEVHGLDQIPTEAAGMKHTFTNSAAHASSIQGGHSHQAPVGILGPGEMEFESIVGRAVARVVR